MVTFFVLSGMITGASWLCYFRALKLGDAGRVFSMDKLSVVDGFCMGGRFSARKLLATNWVG
ncbi:hypothetical protein [Entomobacter blattae]|uniref:hypothetical protein n=1 Tax=Entomobacter blattae TaxID=2762277 RepID=UPI00193B96A4|nr:hypothetical protein [Entomobacter blattae]